MTTLINDNLGFKELFSEHVGSQQIALDFYSKSETELANELQKSLNLMKDSGKLYFCSSELKNLANYCHIAFCDVIEHFLEMDFKRSFAGFGVAIYQGFYSPNLAALAAKGGAKIIDFECANYENGSRYLGFDAAAAHRQAAKILLDAYDSGADFLLVDDASSLEIFDAHKDALKRASNREFDDFYVLSSAEFIALALGKTPATLSSHKLKVSLI